MRKEYLVKAGEFMGCPIYIDTSMRPDEAKMISYRWNEFTKNIRYDMVHLVNLKMPDDA
jgi:hypothetical protein